ncbi:MAG: V-type ATP synthase subunit C [Theionarchaea archaeon]|nr:V-type ATP synthase subunit C [Theionarchaea archaeon]
MRGDVLVIGSKYAYSFGRVKALEAALLDKAQFKRMAEAPTAAEAAKILSETAYADIEGVDIPTMERVLQEELRRVYDLAQHISPRREITDVLQMKYDFHNAKVILKAEVASREPAYLVPLGTVEIENLKKAFKERIKDLPHPLARAVEKARSKYEETGDTQVIDFVMDSEYVQTLLEYSEDYPFLREFFQMKIDLENIRSFVRCQKFGVDFAKVYLEGGTIDLKTFETSRGESLETLSHVVQTRNYSHVVEEGLKQYEETQRLTLYEKLAEDFLIEYVKRAKMVTLGIEPLLGYILAKEREVKQIRLILLGKLKGVDIEKRMSDPYV